MSGKRMKNGMVLDGQHQAQLEREGIGERRHRLGCLVLDGQQQAQLEREGIVGRDGIDWAAWCWMDSTKHNLKEKGLLGETA